MSADFLEVMARSSRERLALSRSRCPEARLIEQARASGAPPRLRLSPEGFDLIAELKLRSPAAGALHRPAADAAAAEAELDARVQGYAAAGAAAVSVLTEPTRFDGELSHLERAARALRRGHGAVPAMRKDFLVDPYQIYEARVAGAGGVLLILRMLGRPQLHSMLQACAELGLFALLEAFDEADLALAAELVETHRARTELLVGVNCRDLATLQVVPGRLEALAHRLPHLVPRVAESGVEDVAAAQRLASVGYDMALVGSALMRATDPSALVRALLGAGRAAAADVRRVHHVDQDLRAHRS